MSTWSRLVRFIPQSAGASRVSRALVGEPVDAALDVGMAALRSAPIEVEVFSGSSVLNPGQRTGKHETVGKLLSPLSQEEVGTIRCIGINYRRHAEEVNMAVPEVPVLFMKPATSLNDPWPSPVPIPKDFVSDDAADYESEVAVVIGKACKDVPESAAMDYLLGYTASNDISSRKAQFAQSQWCYSKGFDGACPIGPALVHKDQIPDIGAMRITGEHNGNVVQDSGLDDLIFSIPKIISFLSRGTTLQPGTVILTGTPAGVGWTMQPRSTLQDGDEFRVSVTHGVGTLVNRTVREQ
ncbi:unnamed protein product [Parajaminaea phylloscopi]